MSKGYYQLKEAGLKILPRQMWMDTFARWVGRERPEHRANIKWDRVYDFHREGLTPHQAVKKYIAELPPRVIEGPSSLTRKPFKEGVMHSMKVLVRKLDPTIRSRLKSRAMEKHVAGLEALRDVNTLGRFPNIQKARTLEYRQAQNAKNRLTRLSHGEAPFKREKVVAVDFKKSSKGNIIRKKINEAKEKSPYFKWHNSRGELNQSVKDGMWTGAALVGTAASFIPKVAPFRTFVAGTLGGAALGAGLGARSASKNAPIYQQRAARAKETRRFRQALMKHYSELGEARQAKVVKTPPKKAINGTTPPQAASLGGQAAYDFMRQGNIGSTVSAEETRFKVTPIKRRKWKIVVGYRPLPSATAQFNDTNLLKITKEELSHETKPADSTENMKAKGKSKPVKKEAPPKEYKEAEDGKNIVASNGQNGNPEENDSDEQKSQENQGKPNEKNALSSKSKKVKDIYTKARKGKSSDEGSTEDEPSGKAEKIVFEPTMDAITTSTGSA